MAFKYRMKVKISILFCALFSFSGIIHSFSQTPAVIISSYYVGASPLDEWTELLVIKDNTNMYNWKLQNTDATQTTWQPAITFSDPIYWNHLRAGTIIIIDRICCNHFISESKGAGYIEVSANDIALKIVFSGGNFGKSPGYNGPTLNINSSGGLLELLDSSGNIVHALGHGAVSGPLFNALSLPKLNYNNSIDTGEAVSVCPGANIDEYGNLAPQDGSTWASAGSGTYVTLGLPNNCSTSSTANSDYWRSLRQPQWINPTLSGAVNGADNLVTLNWNAQVDAYPADEFELYLILRNTSNVFGIPADGQSYLAGENIGGAVVVANIHSSQTLSYVDTVTVPCPTGLYYEIFAYRFFHDYVYGNNYNPARGSSYNETSFAATHVSGVFPVAPLSAASDRNNICSNDNGNITLSATGGSGATLNWHTTSCGGALIGSGSGTTNSITIPSPVTTTTYYASWENFCGVSSCASITVTVIPVIPVSLTLTADHTFICPGTLVKFTASAINEGNSPVYTWTVNGNTVQSGSSPMYSTNTLTVGDIIQCRLTSSLVCPDPDPAESSPLTVSIYAAPVVTLTDKPFLCAGEPIQLNAGSGYASYLWQDGSTSQYYTATNVGTYRVTVSDSHGCLGSDSVQLKNCDSTLFVPDAFSPNGDGVNDVFRVVSSGDNITNFSMQVFDRWGDLVFESSDINKGWDGQLRNQLAPAGTYVWKITYHLSSPSNTYGSTISKHGTVILIR
jgi:gliding motility-associated-like protein